MRFCCIDIGTNSVLYLLAQIDSKKRITPLRFQAVTTRLGEGLSKTGLLNKDAQERTISVIKKFLGSADRYIIAGTSALRIARNKNQFIRSLGLPVKILTEEEEAELVFKSVKHFLKPIPKKVIICDIGGGSTEFVFSVDGNAQKRISIPIGAVNLTEKFNTDIAGIITYIKPLIPTCSGFRLICVGGTVTTLGAIIKRLKYYDPNKVHGTIIPIYKVLYILKKLKGLPLRERRKLICFDPKRADIIIAGLCILKTIMEAFNVDRFKICDRGLIYGLAVSYSKYTRGTFSLQRIS